MASDESDVLAQNKAFYNAFRQLDLEAMETVWSQTEADACIHPGWPILRGWDRVRDSWAGIFGDAGYMRVEPTDIEILLSGDVARVTCVENIYSVHGGLTMQGRIAATNLFQRTGEGWRMVLHHGSPIGATAATGPSDEA